MSPVCPQKTFYGRSASDPPTSRKSTAAQAGPLDGGCNKNVKTSQVDDASYQADSGQSTLEVAENALVKLTAFELFNSADGDPLMCQWLEARGVDALECMNIAGPIVRTSGNIFTDHFQIEHMGAICLAMAVHGEDAETVVDVLGWEAMSPEYFATVYGRAGLLGIDHLLNPASYAGGKPCPIWRTPMRWLQAGCEGVVILDRNLGREDLSRAPGPLAAEDLEHAQDLHNRGLVDASQIMVPTSQEHRA